MTYSAAVPPIKNDKVGDPVTPEAEGYLPAEWSVNVVVVEQKASTGPYARYGIWLQSLPVCLRTTYIVVATLLISLLLGGPVLVACALLISPKFRSVYGQYHDSGEHITGRVVEKRQINNSRGDKKWSTFAVIVEYHYPESNTSSLPFQKQVPFSEAALQTAGETLELVCLPGRPESAIAKSHVDFVWEKPLYKTILKPLFLGLLWTFYWPLFHVIIAHSLTIFLRIWVIVGATLIVGMLFVFWLKVPSEEQMIYQLEKWGEPLPAVNDPEGQEDDVSAEEQGYNTAVIVPLFLWAMASDVEMKTQLAQPVPFK